MIIEKEIEYKIRYCVFCGATNRMLLDRTDYDQIEVSLYSVGCDGCGARYHIISDEAEVYKF